MTDKESTARSRTGATSQNTAATAASSPVRSVLTWAIIVAAIALASAVVYLAFTVTSSRQAPATAQERQLRMLQAMTKERATDINAWADYASALTAAKQYSKAKTVIKHGRSVLNTITPELDVEEARILAAKHDDAGALKKLDEALANCAKARKLVMADMAALGTVKTVTPVKQSAFIDASLMKAGILKRQKKWADEIKALNVALAEDSTQADALTARGFAYLELGKREEARKDFARALEFIPDYAPAAAGMKKLGGGK